ncbi:hypothetical protein SAMN06265350_11218 [Solitalea koreensis]|uniref:Uncharacterized protein n=2 Tax=Solitalea koreensis TaxID=543615 RepID=A0A521E7H3_9SPHI|nr:hypothetical protein SAMN06265350_11218 [Solitalea koreensis]
METKTDKQVMLLAVGVVLGLIGTFSRFIVDSSLSSTIANIILVAGVVVSCIAVNGIITPNEKQ